jgi:hypothetical protein
MLIGSFDEVKELFNEVNALVHFSFYNIIDYKGKIYDLQSNEEIRLVLDFNKNNILRNIFEFWIMN